MIIPLDELDQRIRKVLDIIDYKHLDKGIFQITFVNRGNYHSISVAGIGKAISGRYAVPFKIMGNE
jgi:hypothetical protein